jgi:hypothetical protein
LKILVKPIACQFYLYLKRILVVCMIYMWAG